MRTPRPSLPLVLLLLGGLVLGSADAQQRQQQVSEKEQAPPPEPSPEHVLKDFVKQNMPTHLIEKAKQVARDMPPAEKARLKALAKSAWVKYRPMLGNDSRALAAKLQTALTLVPASKLANLEGQLDQWLDRGGIGAAALAAELMSYDQDELVGRLYGFLEKDGLRLREAAGGALPETQALRGVAAALSVEQLMTGSGAASTRKSLNQLGHGVQVTIDGRTQTLQRWAQTTLTEQFPYLEGTPATSSPEAVLSAALVAPDLTTLMETLPLVVTPFDDPTPAATYLSTADPQDTEGILASFSAIARTVLLRQSLTSGSDLRLTTNSFVELLSADRELSAGSLDLR